MGVLLSGSDFLEGDCVRSRSDFLEGDFLEGVNGFSADVPVAAVPAPFFDDGDGDNFDFPADLLSVLEELGIFDKATEPRVVDIRIGCQIPVVRLRFSADFFFGYEKQSVRQQCYR